MSHTLLIDGNSIGYANQHATRLTVGGMEIQAVFGFIKAIKNLCGNVYPEATPVVLWDGRAQWRFDAYPEYKSNRGDDPKKVAVKTAYEKQTPIIRKMMQMLAVRQITCGVAEADDLAGIMSQRLSSKGQRVTLISGDQDWLQLVNDMVDWFDPIRDHRVSLANFFKFTGYETPAEFLEGKCLVGDTSDKISPVGGIGKETAPVFIAQFKSVENFYKQVEDGTFKPMSLAHKRLLGDSPFTKEQWEATAPVGASPGELKRHMAAWPGQGRLLYARNKRLMDLRNVPKPDPLTIVVDKGEYNEVGFRTLCERLAFASILREFDGFMEPFRSRQPIKVAA